MEKNQGQWRGSIVNIASVAGIRGGNPHLLYPTSKGAIVVSGGSCLRTRETLMVAAEHDKSNGCSSWQTGHPRQLRVSWDGLHSDDGVYSYPSLSATSADLATQYASGMPPEARQRRKDRSVLKTEGTGWDVGACVRFLAGDEARWMTGVILPVDAGATIECGSEVPSVNPKK